MKSLVKARLDEMREAAQKKAIRAEIERLFDVKERQINISTNTIVLAVLHDVFGWGHERLMKFYEECAKYQGAMSGRYGDDCDTTAMRRRLKEECFIDVEELVDKAANDTDRGKTVIDMRGEA